MHPQIAARQTTDGIPSNGADLAILELRAIRQQLHAAVDRCDRLLAAWPISGAPNEHRALQALYRVAPGGPLSEAGIAEIRRRFELRETDATIARKMGISVQGVQKRRARFSAAATSGRRLPGALRNEIHIGADFDEPTPEARDAVDGS